MNALTQLHGNVLTPKAGPMAAWSSTSASAPSTAAAAPQPRVIDEGDYILPGFIDLHVHGGGGRDVMEGGDAVQVLSRLHARHGTTSLLATTMTAPLEELEVALKAIATAPTSACPATRACWGCTWKGPTSTPASWARSPTSPSRPRWSRWTISTAWPHQAHHHRPGSGRPPEAGLQAGPSRHEGADRPHRRQL
jgi:N-acetylglucosamine-6-phosphate deacetylase